MATKGKLYGTLVREARCKKHGAYIQTVIFYGAGKSARSDCRHCSREQYGKPTRRGK